MEAGDLALERPRNARIAYVNILSCNRFWSYCQIFAHSCIDVENVMHGRSSVRGARLAQIVAKQISPENANTQAGVVA